MPCARPVHHRTLLANAFSSRQWALSLSTFPSFPRAMTCKEFWMVAAGQTSAHDEPSQVDHRRASDDRLPRDNACPTHNDPFGHYGWGRRYVDCWLFPLARSTHTRYTTAVLLEKKTYSISR